MLPTQIITHSKQVLLRHWAALVLALIAALVVFTPTIMLWMEPEYQGIEMMMLDAENHYFARVQQVYEGDITIRSTFLRADATPYATPPLGEIIIAFFGKLFGLDAARAAVVSKPFSVAAIVLLIYAFAFSLSRSKSAALIATALPVFGYSLIAFSPAPLLQLFSGSSQGGPFLFFSRLVNSSISGLFLFGTLFIMYRTLFEHRTVTWLGAGALGVLVGTSIYISPYTFSFLGVLLFLLWVWFLVRREQQLALHTFLAGVIALVLIIPFVLNTVQLSALPEYERLARFLGLIARREVVLGLLLPLMIVVVALLWPRQFSRPGRTFLLLAGAALVVVLNQQLLTGTMLQTGHYHWYITKPLAGIVAGLFAGFLITRYMTAYFARATTVFVLVLLVYNSLGFLAPWYEETRAAALEQQRYGPLVLYLATLPQKEIVWADEEVSDFIPIYTAHGSPNSINLGSYPLPETYFDNRLFLEYRLRDVAPEDFEATIRHEGEHVGNRLWGVWLRELTGDPSAVPEESYAHLTAGYAAFYNQPFDEAFRALGITIVVTEHNFESRAAYSFLQEVTTIGTFTVYRAQ